MSVAIGDLRRRLEMDLAHDTPDGAGGFTRTYAAMGAVFAKVTARRRRETVDDGRRVGVITHTITVRWREDLSGSVRFRDGDRIYRVLAIQEADPQRRFLECWCEEEQA